MSPVPIAGLTNDTSSADQTPEFGGMRYAFPPYTFLCLLTMRTERRLRMRAIGRLAPFGLLLQAAVTTANPPPPYPPANPPSQAGPPVAQPALRSYPPSWSYDPYTQGITRLPQSDGY